MEKKSSSLYGILYIVSTPIGNLQDITHRAISTLKSVDLILAEDTRHSGQLCKHYNIEKPLLSLHDHNEAKQSELVLNKLEQGQSLALVSDAGTPLIADPGFILVRMARARGIRVVPVPGCSAVITALSASGLPCDRFRFEGFLPAKSPLRQKTLKTFLHCEETVVVYESTHRILDCLGDIVDIFGAEYRFVLAKELTKTFETFIQDEAATILQWLKAVPEHKKGEFVLIFPPEKLQEKPDESDRILAILLQELPLKQAVKIAGLVTNISKNILYQKALNKQNSSSLD